MKKFLGSLAFALLGGVILTSVPGCKTSCGEDEESGATGCTAKTLTRFNGTPDTKTVPWTSGAPISIETVYGDVKVVQGTADQIEVTFEPFDYEGYDEKDFAVNQMNTMLTLEAGTVIKALRHANADGQDPTNGLGVHVTVKLPSNFDSTLTINNHGDGPLNHFESDIDYAANAVAINVTGGGPLARCNIDGSPTVVNSTVNCGKEVKLVNVSDNINVTVTDGVGFDDPAAYIVLAGISATATGGSVNVADGSIDIEFPSGADYSISANAPLGGVNPNVVPGTCVENAASEQSKAYTCGAGGPTYNLKTDGENDSVFQAGTIYLHM